MASTLSVQVGPLGRTQSGAEYNAWDAAQLIYLTNLTTGVSAGYVQNQANSADYSVPDDGKTYVAKLTNSGGAIYVLHTASGDAASGSGFKMADGDTLTLVLTPGFKISAIDQ